MSQVQSPLFNQTMFRRLIKHILLWALFSYFMRYFVIDIFYKDNSLVDNWLSISLIIQTISIYYFLGHYVFPRYLYNFSIVPFTIWLLVCHFIIYESNYLLFYYLQQINIGPRVERDWQLFHHASWYGCFSNGAAAFFSSFYSFPFAIILLTIQVVNAIIDLRTKNLLLEKDKLNLELDFLKSQVNPHFLFNTLNSVYSRIFDTDEKAADLILRLSELMRYNLYETSLPKIALDKELAYIQNYLGLERNRLSDRYVVIDYEQSGTPSGYQITPLLLITFVENAFKHGIKGATETAYVQVSADVTAGQLVFRVENSIPKKLPVGESDKKSGGIGLGNVRRRLDALYKDNYELVVTPTENTYEVMLIIQVEVLP
ncbi:histidine kinase [Spirosoma foliorum]|uniref:Histidine kinase n=2 Tax=Spirosoma foliorum TaxID=2710596 RepID=A0A7G5GQR7_9BACT|nr:histidine kinase [Spirosoma foliorum]